MKFHSLINILFGCLLMPLLVSSCCNVYDDLSSCPRGLLLQLNSITPCGEELDLKDLNNIEVQIYDKQSQLVATYTKGDLKMNERSEVSIPFYKPGNYTVAVWGLESTDAYASNEHVAMGYKYASQVQKGPIPSLYYGNVLNHHIDHIGNGGTRIDTLNVSLLPYKYDINISLLGLSSGAAYSVEIEDDNANYNGMGQIVPTSIKYMCQTSEDSDHSYKAHFETLRLVRNGSTRIVVKDAKGGIMLEASLEELLATIERVNSIKINLECTHRLDIDLTPIDGAFDKFFISINDWNSVFRRVILGE